MEVETCQIPAIFLTQIATELMGNLIPAGDGFKTINMMPRAVTILFNTV